MKSNRALLGCLLLLPSCCPPFPGQQQSRGTESTSRLIDLHESTRIVRELIEANKIGDLLEGHDPEQLEALLNNMSPVQMAAELEMIQTPVPVVAYFFDPSLHQKSTISMLQSLAAAYDEKVKFVLVDGPKLFQLYDEFNISTLPTVLLLQEGTVVGRLENNIHRSLIEREIVAKFRA